MSNQSALPAINAWQAMELELRSFPVAPQPAAEQEWWHLLTGADCTSVRKRLERVDTGPINGRDLTLILNHQRIDWKVDFHPDPENASVLIGSYVDVRDWFSDIVRRWLGEMSPPLKRIAFAAKLLLKTDSREETYRVLGDYLHHLKVDPASRELLYRINRPRESGTGIANLRINRLSTWASVKMALRMRMRVGTDEIVGALPEENLEGCQVVLDINTSEDREEPFPQDRLADIWNELVQSGSEIVERGDIP